MLEIWEQRIEQHEIVLKQLQSQVEQIMGEFGDDTSAFLDGLMKLEEYTESAARVRELRNHCFALQDYHEEQRNFYQGCIDKQ